MKYDVRSTACALFLAVSVGTAAWASASAGLTGSKHDFTQAGWSGGDLCGACHTPHRSEPPAAAPLWDQDADLSRRFGADIVGDSRFTMGTLMCLRCHDGTIASDTLGGAQEAWRGDRDGFDLRLSGMSAHGSTDHPVGVAFPVFDRGYRPENVVKSRGVPLPGGTVQCSSCHDPHNQSGAAAMLVIPNTGSALCLACHNK